MTSHPGQAGPLRELVAALRASWFARDPAKESAGEFDRREGLARDLPATRITQLRRDAGLVDDGGGRVPVDPMVEFTERYWARREREEPGCRMRHEHPHRFFSIQPGYVPRYVERATFRLPDDHYGTLGGVSDAGA